MTNHMTCDQFADSLSDYLESSAGATTRSAIEAHALGCRDCSALLTDVRKLSVDAAKLPVLTPSRDLWGGIAARIETPVVELKQSAATERWNGGTHRRANRVWMGLAAAGLVFVTATITRELTQRPAATGAPVERTAAAPKIDRDTTVSAPSATPSARPSASQQLATNASASTAQRSDVSVSGTNARSSTTRLASSSTPTAEQMAEQTYGREIATLRVVLKRRRSDLDSATVAVVEHNLKVIDDAIAQCKKALQKDPASRFLIESLNDALDTKLRLLRTAAMLPSRT